MQTPKAHTETSEGLGRGPGMRIFISTYKSLLRASDHYTFKDVLLDCDIFKATGAVAHASNPSTLGNCGGWITRSRDPDHPGQHGENPPLLKIQKLAGCGGSCLQSQLIRRLRQKNCLNPGGGGCSELRWHHHTPAWVTE